MKTSSVSFSLMIIVGCILVFTIPIPVILTYGADQYHINEAGFSALCHVKLKFYTYPHVMLCAAFNRYSVFWIRLDSFWLVLPCY